MPNRFRVDAAGQSQRQRRVGEEIRHILATVVGRGKWQNPLLEDVSLTITEVRVSPDLRNATVFVSPFAKQGQAAQQALKLVNAEAPYVRRQLAQQLTTKFLPQLTFQLDSRFNHASHIEQLLAKPEVARDLQHDSD